MADKQEDKRKALQQRYIEYQMLEQQIRQMQQQLEKLEVQTAEVATVTQSLEDISKTKDGSEVLVPVSGGIFFKAAMKQSNEFLVNVGSGIVVKKDLDGTKKLLAQQEKELDGYKEHIASQLAESIIKYQELEKELKEIMEE